MDADPILPAEDSRAAYARNTAVMTVGTSLSRLTGFLRIATQAAALGLTASALADTYNKANTTPNIIYELALGGILTSVFVPLFVEWMQTKGREEADQVADRILTVSLVALSAIAALGIILAPWIIRLYDVSVHGPGSAEQVELGTFFLRWFMPQIVFYGMGAVVGGLLNANRRFAAPMFAPVLNNLTVIATFAAYVWILHGGVPRDLSEVTTAQRTLLAAGTTLGVFAMTAALWPSLRATGYRWRLRFDWNHPALRRLLRLAAWVVVYVVANQGAYIIVIILATGLGNGRFSAYAYAFIVFSLPYAIFGVSIYTALLPGMASRWTAGSRDGVLTLFSRGLRDTAVIIVPAALGFIALALPISQLIFEHLHSGAADADLIARTLRAFSVGLPFFAMFQLLTRTFYAMQDTRTPALVNIGAAAVNIAADLAYTRWFGLGIPGLALGHATSYVFSTAVCLVILRRRLGQIDGRRITRTLARAIPAAVFAGIAAYAVTLAFPRHAGAAGQLIQVLVGVTAGVLVFGVCALIFKIEEVDEVKSAVLRRFRA